MKNEIIDKVLKEAQITTINNKVEIKNIDFKHLPKQVKELIKKADIIRSSGWQEIIGYIGRQAIWAMGGSWDKDNFKLGEVPIFIPDNFGGKYDGKDIQWNGSKVTVKEIEKKAELGNMSYEDMVEVMKSLKEGDTVMIIADSKRRQKDNIVLEVTDNSVHSGIISIGIKLRKKPARTDTRPGSIYAVKDKVYWMPTMMTQTERVYSIEKI